VEQEEVMSSSDYGNSGMILPSEPYEDNAKDILHSPPSIVFK